MNSTLDIFKDLRRNAFVMHGNTDTYDVIIKDIENMLRDDDERDMNDALLYSLKQEYDNMDKSAWYHDHFDTWVHLPKRQECAWFSIEDRLRYSQCRIEMFDHIEYKFKQRTFPNISKRLSFF
tara:strand:- start:1545 stop:1913 length:369 start_codon:yes stop_codon:yes gene_type:complete